MSELEGIGSQVQMIADRLQEVHPKLLREALRFDNNETVAYLTLHYPRSKHKAAITIQCYKGFAPKLHLSTDYGSLTEECVAEILDVLRRHE